MKSSDFLIAVLSAITPKTGDVIATKSVEKPIATNYDDTIKIFKTLNKSDVFFLEAIAYRSHEQTKFVINKITEITINFFIISPVIKLNC